MRETSEADVSELGELLGVAFSARERADAVDRLNTLADIYEQLEAVPTDDPRAQNGSAETFESRPRPPRENPHNAWLSRLDLVRRDSERGAVGPRRRY